MQFSEPNPAIPEPDSSSAFHLPPVAPLPYKRRSRARFRITDWQDLILVNQVGKRFYDETAEGWPYGTHHGFLEPYVQGDWRNARRIMYRPQNFLDAALAPNDGSQAPDFRAGPIF